MQLINHYTQFILASIESINKRYVSPSVSLTETNVIRIDAGRMTGKSDSVNSLIQILQPNKEVYHVPYKIRMGNCYASNVTTLSSLTDFVRGKKLTKQAIIIIEEPCQAVSDKFLNDVFTTFLPAGIGNSIPAPIIVIIGSQGNITIKEEAKIDKAQVFNEYLNELLENRQNLDKQIYAVKSVIDNMKV